MSSILKWFLFTILTLSYIWAVFIWDKGPDPETEDLRFEANFENANALFNREANEIESEILQTENVTDDSLAEFEQISSDVETESIEVSYQYYIISGSYREESQAILARDQYIQQGIDAEVLKIAPLYKVIIAKAEDLEQAKNFVKDFDQKGIPAFHQKI